MKVETVAMPPLPISSALTHPNLDDSEPCVIICGVISAKCISHFFIVFVLF